MREDVLWRRLDVDGLQDVVFKSLVILDQLGNPEVEGDQLGDRLSRSDLDQVIKSVPAVHQNL